MKKREGYKLVKQFPEGEHCVSMLVFKGDILIATNKHVYKMVEEVFEKLEIKQEVGPAL